MGTKQRLGYKIARIIDKSAEGIDDAICKALGDGTSDGFDLVRNEMAQSFAKAFRQLMKDPKFIKIVEKEILATVYEEFQWLIEGDAKKAIHGEIGKAIHLALRKGFSNLKEDL